MYLNNKSNGMNQVEINACWRESVRKEGIGRILHEKFDFDPKNLIAITEKPTQVKQRPSTSDVEHIKLLKTKLAQSIMIPKKKFNVPQTAA